MNETLLYQWEKELTNWFVSLNSWQVQNVALFTQGVVEAESCQQAEICRKVVSGWKARCGGYGGSSAIRAWTCLR